MIAAETFNRHHTNHAGYDLLAIYNEYYGGEPQNPQAYTYLSLPETLFPINSRQVACAMIAWARVLDTARSAP